MGFANELAKLVFQAVDIADFAVNDPTSPQTDIYVRLHTADPSGGTQATSEATYTGYGGGSAVPRDATGWAVNGIRVDNVDPIVFGECTAVPNAITHWSVGKAASGASQIVKSGAFGPVVGPFVAEADSDLITSKGHGLNANDRVVFSAPAGATLPTGISAGTVYFVISSGLTTDDFKISTTQGGSAVDITVDGDGLCQKVVPLNVDVGITPTIPAGALDIDFSGID